MLLCAATSCQQLRRTAQRHKERSTSLGRKPSEIATTVAAAAKPGSATATSAPPSAAAAKEPTTPTGGTQRAVGSAGSYRQGGGNAPDARARTATAAAIAGGLGRARRCGERLLAAGVQISVLCVLTLNRAFAVL